MLRLAELGIRFHGIHAKYSSASSTSSKTLAADLQNLMRRSGLQYYADCQLTMYQKRQADGANAASSKSFYLTLQSGQLRSSEYRKDQLWVIGSRPDLDVPNRQGPCDRMARPFTVVARSCWHGPNHEGK